MTMPRPIFFRSSPAEVLCLRCGWRRKPQRGITHRCRVSRFEHVRNRYGVPAARGRRISFDGRPGQITSSRGKYIAVRLDDAPGRTLLLHPTWRVLYYAPWGDFDGLTWTEAR
jgi:hypothetical protein